MPRGGDWGIIAIAVAGFGHNIIAAGRRREMICGAIRRHHREHPIPTLLIVAYLVTHAFGWLKPAYDPLYQIGALTERLAELLHRL